MKPTLNRRLRQGAGMILAFCVAGCGLSTPSALPTAPSTGTTVEPRQAVADAAASATDVPAAAETGAGMRPAGWSEASHGADVEPDYAVVFPEDAVNELTIKIAPEDWDAMLADMTEIFGEQGKGQGGGPGGNGPQNGGVPMGGGVSDAENPMWVSATITFNGETWTNVGVRFKGNSSLRSTWASGALKLPLKLDFDQYEDQYPEIADQRFYGFKQLSLANGFGDATYMREVVSYDLLAQVGLTASKTAYYTITIDHGEGPVDLGLYLAVEVVDDTVIDRVYGDDSGNIYEADGAAASLAAGTQEQIGASFQKENNSDEADWSDVEALQALLNSDLRTTDPAAWRAQLEAIFNVDDFLTWLALKTVIQHWDSYGGMSHNYYLYHNPETGQLDFISWDHNLTLGAQFGPGGRGGGGPSRAATSFDLAEVKAEWPLIRYLLDDAEYQTRYIAALRQVDATFDADTLSARYAQLSALIEPVLAETGDTTAFNDAVNSLIATTQSRDTALAEFLTKK